MPANRPEIIFHVISVFPVVSKMTINCDSLESGRVMLKGSGNWKKGEILHKILLFVLEFSRECEKGEGNTKALHASLILVFIEKRLVNKKPLL